MYDSNISHKKKYGQFFSGSKVAELLVSMIPEEAKIESMIDPMVGVGDLICAAQKRFSDCTSVYGIEIDEKIINTCKKNIPDAIIVNADAFSRSPKVPDVGWDLVITNPPYVRYQLQRGDDEIPSSEDVRNGLIKSIECAGHLSTIEKELFINIANKYSGLSDLAVPSWVLCASMVKIGGYLAIVVPETWLSRNYSDIIQFLLLKAFKVISITKDVDRKWFEDAQVRTYLIVAQRKEISSLDEMEGGSTFCVDLSSELTDNDSLVSKLNYGNLKGIDAFKKILFDRHILKKKGIKTKNSSTVALLNRGLRYGNDAKWLDKNDRTCIDAERNIPEELKNIVQSDSKNGFCNLTELGWDVGQGLRTGANDFFYGTLIQRVNNRLKIRTQEWYGQEIEIDKNDIILAIKRQSEILKVAVTSQDITNCIFYVGKQVKKDDYGLLASSYVEEYTCIDEALERYISSAEKYILPNGKKFKDLSAVKTNEKRIKDGYIRFWYMLPDLQRRHVPDICIPRVCGRAVYSIFVRQTTESPIVVDANFTTMWCKEYAEKPLMIAMLNSSWFKAYMEIEGAVMGGGALKVEAAHVKKALFPRMSSGQKNKLIQIGKKIIENGHIAESDFCNIDATILSSFGSCKTDLLQNKIQKLLDEKLSERGAL